MGQIGVKFLGLPHSNTRFCVDSLLAGGFFVGATLGPFWGYFLGPFWVRFGFVLGSAQIGPKSDPNVTQKNSPKKIQIFFPTYKKRQTNYFFLKKFKFLLKIGVKLGVKFWRLPHSNRRFCVENFFGGRFCAGSILGPFWVRFGFDPHRTQA